MGSSASQRSTSKLRSKFTHGWRIMKVRFIDALRNDVTAKMA